MEQSGERGRLEWPEQPESEWDDLDRIIAEHVHERDCQRWPHRACRRVILRGQWSWNRWARGLAHLLCDRTMRVYIGGPDVAPDQGGDRG